VHERPFLTCCQFASDEDLETESDLFNCDACPVRDALDALWPENAAAWALFNRIARRFVADLHAGGEALHRLTADLDAEDFADLLDRLTLIYDVVCPPPEPKA
jgi:hypothetical protein